MSRGAAVLLISITMAGRISCRSMDMSTRRLRGDRKSTRLNSSHGYISYAVFCLKKKKRTCIAVTSIKAILSCSILRSLLDFVLTGCHDHYFILLLVTHLLRRNPIQFFIRGYVVP